MYDIRTRLLLVLQPTYLRLSGKYLTAAMTAGKCSLRSCSVYPFVLVCISSTQYYNGMGPTHSTQEISCYIEKSYGLGHATWTKENDLSRNVNYQSNMTNYLKIIFPKLKTRQKESVL